MHRLGPFVVLAAASACADPEPGARLDLATRRAVCIELCDPDTPCGRLDSCTPLCDAIVDSYRADAAIAILSCRAEHECEPAATAACEQEVIGKIEPTLMYYEMFDRCVAADETCSTSLDCSDPWHRLLADAVLRAMAMCFVPPCEDIALCFARAQSPW